MALTYNIIVYRINPVRCAAAAGVVALSLPFIVGAAGFGVGGIGAGTFGSWLMSWYGGSVPASGLVAYLQSLGAAGLTSFATTATGQALVVLGCLSQIEEDEC